MSLAPYVDDELNKNLGRDMSLAPYVDDEQSKILERTSVWQLTLMMSEAKRVDGTSV